VAGRIVLPYANPSISENGTLIEGALDVLPPLSIDHTVDQCAGEVGEPLVNFLPVHSAVEHAAHVENDALIDFGAVVRRPPNVATAPASFGLFVRHVVGVGSKEQMGGIHAGRVIAFVQDEKAVGNGTDEKPVAFSMCFAGTMFECDVPVAFRVSAPGPFPTVPDNFCARNYPTLGGTKNARVSGRRVECLAAPKARSRSGRGVVVSIHHAETTIAKHARGQR